MNGFTKLFSDIVDSSIWEEDSDTCKVWVTLMALADETGFVRGSSGWLASKSKVSKEVCERALTAFESPDPKSRTTTDDGRRIKTVERGWILINYEYFRNEHSQLSTDPRRIYQREWMRKKRMTTACQQSQQVLTNVNPASASASVPLLSTVSSIENFREQISQLFSRKKGDPWSYQEETALVEVFRRPDHESELQQIIKFKPDAGKFFPRSVSSLLEKWNGTLDSSRVKKPNTRMNQLR